MTLLNDILNVELEEKSIFSKSDREYLAILQADLDGLNESNDAHRKYIDQLMELHKYNCPPEKFWIKGDDVSDREDVLEYNFSKLSERLEIIHMCRVYDIIDRYTRYLNHAYNLDLNIDSDTKSTLVNMRDLSTELLPVYVQQLNGQGLFDSGVHKCKEDLKSVLHSQKRMNIKGKSLKTDVWLYSLWTYQSTLESSGCWRLRALLRALSLYETGIPVISELYADIPKNSGDSMVIQTYKLENKESCVKSIRFFASNNGAEIKFKTNEDCADFVKFFDLYSLKED